MINFDMRAQADVWDAAINILAVEFLVKENNPQKYSENHDILSSFDDIDMEDLRIDLSLNMHIQNLGEMISQGDYDEQKEILFRGLKTKKEKGSYCGY